jgi:hypothetical protein
MPGSLHDSHCPVHADAQQTPSAQKPLGQSPFARHIPAPELPPLLAAPLLVEAAPLLLFASPLLASPLLLAELSELAGASSPPQAQTPSTPRTIERDTYRVRIGNVYQRSRSSA